MPIWEALEYLNTLVDHSDPDIELPQIENLLQTTKAIRRDGSPAGVDGRLSDLESKYPRNLLPLISDRWNSHFNWNDED